MHRYTHLAEQGEAKPFTCPNCSERLAFVPDVKDEPVAWCYFCDSGFTPGTVFWADVRAVVTEFYLE